ncbi:VWA domain-containing protein (plasmid) [Deinococcus taeanensis]|uniref:vWA domain-containing protein n=1 Tax=Deinococcus taeanensis TaxID=2737050 RepID=UPI001CDD0DFE|nr:VWA domain-containing protein [Deinococcus taeanensis]UBV44338.1 VWA domain-containing protein [Deinococcus taeanensis]
MNKLPLVLSTLALTLAACTGRSTPAPTAPAATTGTINGVRVQSATSYQFGFTPLSGTELVTTATLKDVTVKQLSAGQATARVCGNVQAQDVITAAISLDSTGSMADNDPGRLRNTAAKAFVDRMTAADQAAVLSFDAGTAPTTGMLAARLWQTFTSDKTKLAAAVNQATFERGGTPLYDAMIDTSRLLKATGKTNVRALILTDGENNSGTNNGAAVVTAANTNGTPMYIIGLDAQNNLDFTAAEDIAARTGGLFQRATTADQLGGFFDRMYNAFRAQGCVELNFTTKPASGTSVTGTLNIVVAAAGKKDSAVQVPFTVTVR